MKLSAFLFAVSICAFVIAGADAEDFAGLSKDAKGYTQVTPGRALVFPRDHGPHEDFRTEWWYLTANLTDESGAAYGVQWTLFRQAMTAQTNGEGWANGQLWMAHAAATSARAHLVAEKFARGGVGQAGVTAAPFHAFIDDWIFSAEGEDLSKAQIVARGDNFSYRLDLAASGPLVLQGEAGYSRKSEGPQASYYYSQPFFDVKGALVMEGREIKVTGRAWMDREWSSQQLAPNQKGWDWFALHFNSGEKLMLYRMKDETPTGYLSGTWIGADGATEPLRGSDIVMTPLNETRIEDRVVPTRWRLRIEKHSVNVETNAVNPQSWMKTSFPYWEGPIIIAGSHAGVGYLEMTGAERSVKR